MSFNRRLFCNLLQRHDMVERRHDIKANTIQRHYDVVCLLGKTSDCKTQITVKKNCSLRISFPLIGIVSNVRYPTFWLLKQCCWDHPSTFYSTV